MKNFTIITLLITTTLLLGACAPDRSTKIYTSAQALQAEDVEEGVVESVQEAKIRKEDTPVGSIAGAAIGGIAASGIGGGKGSAIASVAGAVVGGFLGDKAEKLVTDKKAYKIVVKLDSGQKIVVVQQADVPFQPGERVNVFSSRVDNTKRVSKL